MTERTITVGGTTRSIAVQGADGAPGALVLAGAGQPAPDVSALTSRLVNSGLQCFVVRGDPLPDHDGVVDALDQLGLHWVNLVGIGDGAVIAWETAARHFGKVSSLVVLDRGHPAAADGEGGVGDPDCPAVDVSATLVLVSPGRREQAYASGRHAYSDFRVVDLTAASSGGADDPTPLATALATEVILRSSPW